MLFQNIWQRLRRAGGAALVGYKGTTLETFLNRAATRFSWASASDLPRFMKTIRSYRNDLHLPTNVVYFGNSVDNGASLDDPVNDAPGAYFVRMLKKLFGVTISAWTAAPCQNFRPLGREWWPLALRRIWLSSATT
jgi:hypothetical protein